MRNALRQPTVRERIEIARRLSVVAAAEVQVETLMLWKPGVVAEVPFADVAGLVAGLLQHFRDGDFFVLKPEGVRRAKKFAIGPADIFRRITVGCSPPAALKAGSNPIRDTQTRRITAGHYRRPRRRTDRAGGISIGKSHALACQTVDVRRFVKRASLAAKVFPTQIVDQHQHDIQRRLGRAGRQRDHQEGMQGDEQGGTIHFCRGCVEHWFVLLVGLG